MIVAGDRGVRSGGHFDFQLLGADGSPVGDVTEVSTTQGVVLLSHHKCNVLDIGHLCDLAHNTPDYPHDICLWEGPDPNPTLAWSARIHWRTTE